LKVVVKLKYIILAKAVVTPAAPELGVSNILTIKLITEVSPKSNYHY
jgi:hypothetical protein